MITELTKEQRAKLPEYAQRGIELGLKTGPYTAEEQKIAKQAVEHLYADYGREKPIVLIAPGPRSAIIMRDYATKVLKIMQAGYDDNEIEREIDGISREISGKIYRKIAWEISEEISREIDNEIDGIRREIRNEIDNEIAWEIISEISGVSDELRREISREIDNEISEEISEIDRELRREIGCEIDGEISRELRWEIGRELRSEISREVRLEIDRELRWEIDREVRDIRLEIDREIFGDIGVKRKTHPLYAQYWVYWVYYQKYFIDQNLINLDANLKKRFERLVTLVETCGCIDLMGCLAIVWERPEYIRRNANGLLHCDSGPALKFRDGFALYRLNGVKVPKDIACLHHSKIPVSRWVEETNVEVKREIIRKIGIERIYNELGATVLDAEPENGYELIEMQLTPETKGRYLKMVNPSIKTIHIEGVGNECRTVQDAIDYRKPVKLRNIPVSDTGADWHQQGDVCIWPRNAKTVKPRPAVLT